MDFEADMDEDGDGGNKYQAIDEYEKSNCPEGYNNIGIIAKIK